MDEVIETYLPSNKKINKFFSLPDKQKVQVIELGLSLFENGMNKVQYMNNEEWETKMEGLKQNHAKEKEQLDQNISYLEDRMEEFTKKNHEEKQHLIYEIKQNESMRFNEEISHFKQENSQLTNKLSLLTSEYHEIHTVLDNKYTERLNQKEGFYEDKLKEQQKRLDDQRTEYEDKLEVEKQKYETIIKRTSNSTIKGQDGEDYAFNQLNLLFPKAEIEDTHKMPGRGDFIMREDDFIMMIETKNYTKNVQKTEVDKFYRDIDSHANNDVQCAVLISLHSGICCKSDFEFEVRNGKPILFLHNVQCCMENLRLATKFFKLIVGQKQLDLSNKEIIGSFKNLATALKRNFTKQRNKLDKYYKEQSEVMLEQEQLTMQLYKTINMKY